MIKLIFGTVLLVCGMAGVQHSEEKNKFMLLIGEDGVHIDYQRVDDMETLDLKVDGETVTVDVSDLGPGDSKTVILPNDQEMEILREEESLILDIASQRIVLGDHHGGEGHAFVHADGENRVAVVEMVEELIGGHANKVRISGLEDLDEETKQRVAEALRELGIDKEVEFNHGHGIWIDTDGDHHNLLGNSFIFKTDDEGGEDAKVIRLKSGTSHIVIEKQHDGHEKKKKKKELH